MYSEVSNYGSWRYMIRADPERYVAAAADEDGG